MGKITIKRILMFLLFSIIVFFLGRYSHKINLLIMDNNLYGNIIDFLGNISIALTSAGIAWYVSYKESSKNQRKYMLEKKQEQLGMLKLLALENTFNKASFETISETNNCLEKQSELSRLRTKIWDSLKFKLDQPSQVLEDIYLYYYQIESAKELSKEGIEEDPKILEDLAQMNLDILEMIEALIKNINENKTTFS
ncbi:hypothetical protein [Enterococcus gallinarum]|uniref:hypothetical protein n=1 Tax=Enterococcus gallinarum TaxID=1353 RepID=UPI001D17B3BC|nr:hypothetical protein [Enterococcus gallinarum]MCC4043738.1 hypothetical protein [Enterococcus gallinarum]